MEEKRLNARRRYLLTATLPPLTLFAVTLVFAFLFEGWILGFGLILCALVTALCSRWSARLHIFPLLFRDLDPDAYLAVRKSFRRSAPAGFDCFLIPYIRGEYPVAIRQIRAFLAQSPNQAVFWGWALRCYLECRDPEGLKKVLESCTLPQEKRPFFDAFAAGDYRTALELRRKQEAGLQKLSSRLRPMQEVMIRYDQGVCLYLLGEFDAAKQIFQQIRQRAPKLHYAVLAQEYLTAMESGQLLQPIDTEGLAEGELAFGKEADTFAAVASMKKEGRRRLILTVVGSLLVIVGLCLSVFPIRSYGDALHQAVAQEYAEYEILAYERISEEGKILDALCVIESEGKLHLLSIGQMGDTGEIYAITYLSDLQMGQLYFTESQFQENRTLFIELHDKKGDCPENAHGVIKIQDGWHTDYLSVTVGVLKPA